MRIMLVSKNAAFVNVVILCLFVYFVGATELSASEATPSRLESDSVYEAKCDCGPHGACEIDKKGKKNCTCNAGFFVNDNNEICEECDCGKAGWCVFIKGVKTCLCKPDTAMKDGICTACTCHLPLVDGGKLTLSCTFENGVEICQCPSGYLSANSSCIDIDECLDKSSCPNDTRCENYPGYYMCFCKKSGYTGINNDPKKYGCRDIDECVEYNACSHNSTTCTNTDGSFYCECKPGYSLKYGDQSTMRLLGCDKDGLGAGYIALIVIAVIVVVAVAAFAIKKVFFR